MTPLRLLAVFMLLAAASPASGTGLVDPDPRPACSVDAATGRRVCCRVCSRGKACGNSCIAAWKNCHRGVGCACDAGGGGSSSSRSSSGVRSRRSAVAAPTETMREVQRMLKRLGYYDGEVDGLDGPGTRAAVRSFQRDHDIEPVDGTAGAATRARLRREASRGR